MGIYRGDKNIVATIHYSSYTFDEKKINVSYFKRFLKSAEFVKLLQEQVKGGIKTEIKPKHLLPLEINLPDIKEQKIIVKKLKAIETEENELKQEIAQQQILLKNLRQQILQEAIEGKLTQDWRVKNPNTEPASELLKRIQAEKQQLIKDKKIKAQKPLPAISEDEKPFKLPDGWVWCRLNDILSEILGGHSFKSSLFKKYGEKQVLRLGNIRPYHVRLERNSVYIDEKTANKARSAKLKQGDILITMTGTRGKRDYCYTVLLNELHFKDRELYLNQRVGCLRFNKYVSLKYYDYCLKNNRLLDQIFSTATGSANQANIGISALISWLIPMPSTQEQKTIVAKVEKLLNICDKLQTQITANQIYAEQLMQAVLKEAFTQAEQPI
ncbi:MAG: hypothetical protein HFP81_04825 [Methylococcales symbiont of Hymedesmia sp. n. MRB-2018]|nr:MAG: hypothetical protein HFP81_04825 [Methylococcales symbiont of Hymedesmia sp. n. MRB-2018]